MLSYLVAHSLCCSLVPVLVPMLMLSGALNHLLPSWFPTAGLWRQAGSWSPMCPAKGSATGLWHSCHIEWSFSPSALCCLCQGWSLAAIRCCLWSSSLPHFVLLSLPAWRAVLRESSLKTEGVYYGGNKT